MTKKEKFNIYKMVTDKVIERIEETGELPWERPWKLMARPMNLRSKKAYRGFNVFWLAFQGFGSRWWLTFNQCKQMGGKVKKDEKSTIVVFWKWVEYESKDQTNPETGDPEKHTVPLIRYYRVFNVEQCEGLEKKIPSDEEVREIEERETAQAIIDAMPQKPEIKHGGDRAAYSLRLDYITMPLQERFTNDDAYYTTLFHELVHSTGNEKRLNRFGDDPALTIFNAESYSKEELVAELGASFLANVAGLEWDQDNTAAYIAGWKKRLTEEPKWIVNAAQAAQKAADFILNVKAVKAEKKEAA